jgi:predicted enzyme related to lactoylglutathione lyase
MNTNPVVWFEIYVQDINKAKDFYEQVLEVKLESLTPPDGELSMFAFPGGPENSGATGALVKVEGKDSAVNSTIIYFGCDDCAVEESRIEAAGGKVERAKMSIGEYGFISLALDTDGNMFGLHSMK